MKEIRMQNAEWLIGEERAYPADTPQWLGYVRDDAYGKRIIWDSNGDKDIWGIVESHNIDVITVNSHHIVLAGSEIGYFRTCKSFHYVCGRRIFMISRHDYAAILAGEKTAREVYAACMLAAESEE